MAEMNVPAGGGKKGGGGKRSKKLSTRVDLTPMVDLGFLLITFFMLTTTLSKPQAMELNMPAKPEDTLDQPPVMASKVMTLVLGPRDKLYYYNLNPDNTPQPPDSIDFSVTSNVEKILRDKQDYVRRAFNDTTDAIVLIKPMRSSTYRNFVDIVDEMSILNEVATKGLTKEQKKGKVLRFVPDKFTSNDSTIIFGGAKPQ